MCLSSPTAATPAPEHAAVEVGGAAVAPPAAADSPFTQVALQFQDVTKSVPDPSAESGLRQVLHGVSGSARPGELLALMGPSGSGKTTLLNAFHPERAGAHVGGSITLNGVPLEKSMKRKISYVWQEDVLFMSLTTKESLEYTARLRLSGPQPPKLAAAARAMRTLGLDKCANTPIMMLSGGEKKRVSIATELIFDPALILLDEPTSGLDAASAQTLVQALRTLAAGGHTVVSSIHQPSSRIFLEFDKMLLLADGHTCFYGAPPAVAGWFAGAGYPVPANFNPADHIMDVVNAPGGSAEARAALIKRFGQAQAEKAGAATQLLSRQSSLVGSPDEVPAATADVGSRVASKPVSQPALLSTARSLKGNGAAEGPKWPTTWGSQFTVLTSRNWRLGFKNFLNPVNVIQCLAITTMVSLFWLRMEYTEDRVPDRVAFGFFAGVFWPFNTMFSSIQTFPSDRVNLERERAAGSYRLSAYFLSKLAIDIPFQLFYPTVYTAVTWWASGARDSAGAFFGILGVTYLNVLAAGGIGLVFGTSIRDFRYQLMAATLFMLMSMLLGGFFISVLPSWLTWAKYLSFMRYMFNLSMMLVFGEDTPCDGSDVLTACDGLDTGVATSDEVLSYLGVTTSAGVCVGALLGFASVSRVLAYLALRFVDTSALGRK